MKYVVPTMLLIVGLIHLTPVTGVTGVGRLNSLYGIMLDEPNLILLMRHRAVLFGLLGVFLVYAAFRPMVQPLALIAGFISVVSFLWLAQATENHNEQIARVFAVDLVALFCLIAGTRAYVYMLSVSD